MEKDTVFSIFVSAIFPTWHTHKPDRLRLATHRAIDKINFNGYPHICHHVQVAAEVTVDIARHGWLPYVNMVETIPDVDCISGTRWGIDEILTDRTTCHQHPTCIFGADNIVVVTVGTSLISMPFQRCNILTVYSPQFWVPIVLKCQKRCHSVVKGR